MSDNKKSLHTPIKLHVHHHKDMELISAHVQDAIFTSKSFEHAPESKSFKLLGNRFCWEKFLSPSDPIKTRVHSGIHFDHVLSVKKRNMDLHHPEQLYNLMRISAEANKVELVFSNNASININVEKISCKMADLHEPYPTKFLPSHSKK